YGMTFTPDSQMLALGGVATLGQGMGIYDAATITYQAAFYDVTTGQAFRRAPKDAEAEVARITFTTNGRFAAFVLRDRSELARLFRQGRRPQSRRVVVWDWPHKRRVSQLDLPPTWDLITSEFVLSPDGKFLAVGGSNREPLNLFDTESGQVRYTLRDSVCAPAFSPDGHWLITACAAEDPAGAEPG